MLRIDEVVALYTEDIMLRGINRQKIFDADDNEKFLQIKDCKGLSIRQILRLTGISFGIDRRI
jgi:hypothetical protein